MHPPSESSAEAELAAAEASLADSEAYLLSILYRIEEEEGEEVDGLEGVDEEWEDTMAALRIGMQEAEAAVSRDAKRVREAEVGVAAEASAHNAEQPLLLAMLPDVLHTQIVDHLPSAKCAPMAEPEIRPFRPSRSTSNLAGCCPVARRASRSGPCPTSPAVPFLLFCSFNLEFFHFGHFSRACLPPPAMPSSSRPRAGRSSWRSRPAASAPPGPCRGSPSSPRTAPSPSPPPTAFLLSAGRRRAGRGSSAPSTAARGGPPGEPSSCTRASTT